MPQHVVSVGSHGVQHRMVLIVFFFLQIFEICVIFVALLLLYLT